ncbi:acyltransferase family protein [Luteibaculum oceani]|uniref:Acyltransferase n=1 Tax=Luteibaculum oceani TaxID=1294296 RepID=A0A5C6V117_9FLAO|nr:acyltransferase [Luteibaculum oceani]TXC78311.1 acyltransferase [Luteibaculum oceani]
MKRLQVIEFLKGFSIFTIVIFHLLQKAHLEGILSKLIGFGGTGIHLFVLLSGFGLYLSFQKKPLALVPFLKKRFSKIYIPYILVVLFSALISLFIPLFENSWFALGGHVFLYKMFNESIMGSYGYPFWFVSMIIQFYLVFHLLVFVKKRVPAIPFFIGGLIISLSWSFLVLYLGKAHLRVWNSFFLQYLWEFALGMVLAERYATGKGINWNPGVLVVGIIAIVNCALYALLALKGGETGKMLNDIPALLGYSFAALFLYKLPIAILKKFFLFTGGISFSVYLWHIFSYRLLAYVMGDASIAAVLILSLLLCYLIAWKFQDVVNWIYKKLGV